ncbi:ion channel protein, partial [Cystoisospora suis]
MGLQVETSYLLWRQVLRLFLDCSVVGIFVGCMVYIATYENTWSTVSMRFVPSLLGWLFFILSLFLFERLYEVYLGITTGQWPVWATHSTAGSHKVQRHLMLAKDDEEGLEHAENEAAAASASSGGSVLLSRTSDFSQQGSPPAPTASGGRRLARFNRLATDFKMRKKLRFRQGIVRAAIIRLLYWHHLLRHHLHRQCSKPSFALATVVWNFAWSASWCHTLYRWRRDTFD